MQSDSRPSHLIYLALTGTHRNRRMMRAIGLLVTRLRSVMGRAGGAPPSLVIHAPGADGQGVRWPSDVEVVSSADVLQSADVARAGDLALAEGAALIESTHAWPTLDGVHLGLINRSLIQEALFELHEMRSSLARVLESRPTSGCTIVAGTPREGEPLREVAEGAGVRARVVALPRWVATLSMPTVPRRRSGERLPASSGGTAIEPGASRLVLVSESMPMAGMYDEIERALDAAGISDFTRVQYFLDESRSPQSDDPRRVHWHRPEFAPPPQGPLPVAPRRLHGGTARHGMDAAVDDLVDGITRAELPAQMAHVPRIRAFLERVDPELVVVGNDRWWIGLCWVLSARALGIPSLMVQDGVATRHPKWRNWCADRVAVNGRHLGDILEDAGCPPERIVVVGQPRYDSIQLASGSRGESSRDPAGPASVLFATQPDQDASYVEAVLEVICASGVDAVLRPHPSTSSASLAQLREIGDRLGARWAAGGPIDELIRASDVVVVRDSTVALEAALEGVPVITVNLTGAIEAVPYADLGVSREVTNAASLREALSEVVEGRLPSVRSSGDVRAGVEYLVGPCDGGSAERVVDVIGDMLRAGPGGQDRRSEP